jgi:hypothetical protein
MSKFLANENLLEVLAQPVAWEAHFGVAQEGRLRVVPLP